MSDYDTDVLLWSEHQTELLRRIAAGEPVNESPDWPNIIEEVGDVGLSSLRACRSLLVRALIHMLKAMAWPSSREVPHWAAEARRFRGDAADAFQTALKACVSTATPASCDCAGSEGCRERTTQPRNASTAVALRVSTTSGCPSTSMRGAPSSAMLSDLMGQACH